MYFFFVCHSIHVDVRGQLFEVSLLLLCESFRNWTQVSRLGKQEPLPAEPSLWFSISFYIAISNIRTLRCNKPYLRLKWTCLLSLTIFIFQLNLQLSETYKMMAFVYSQNIGLKCLVASYSKGCFHSYSFNLSPCTPDQCTWGKEGEERKGKEGGREEGRGWRKEGVRRNNFPKPACWLMSVIPGFERLRWEDLWGQFGRQWRETLPQKTEGENVP